MKGTHLGEFEELVLLAVGALADDAYGVAIKEFITKKANRKPSIGALHSALSRLEDKAFLKAKSVSLPRFVVVEGKSIISSP